MKHVFFALSILLAPSVHAEMDFDRWRFSELVVTGLKQAQNQDIEGTTQTLETLRHQLVRLNLEINHLHPNDRMAGLALARDLLIDPVYQAWATERIEGGVAEKLQRQFLARLFELGLTDSIEKTTAYLKLKASNDSEGVRTTDHLMLGGGVGTFFGAAVYYAIHTSDPGPAFFGFLASFMSYAVGFIAISSYRLHHEFFYKTNFMSPVFRECEIALLREGHAGLAETRLAWNRSDRDSVENRITEE